MKKFEFATLPAVGLALSINGQRYDLVAVEPYTRQDGEASHLAVWHADCATCGDGFTAKQSARRMPETRRCEACRPTRGTSLTASPRSKV